MALNLMHDPFVQVIRASDDKDKNERLARYVAWTQNIGYDEAKKKLKEMGMI